MGTSKAYDAPTTPQWKNLKTSVTKLARKGRPGTTDSERVVRGYVDARWGTRTSRGFARS